MKYITYIIFKGKGCSVRVLLSYFGLMPMTVHAVSQYRNALQWNNIVVFTHAYFYQPFFNFRYEVRLKTKVKSKLHVPFR